MIKQACRGRAIAKSRTRVRGINSSPSIVNPHFLRLHDLRDPDFARGKLSYRGRRGRRFCKIMTFPLRCDHSGPSFTTKEVQHHALESI